LGKLVSELVRKVIHSLPCCLFSHTFPPFSADNTRCQALRKGRFYLRLFADAAALPRNSDDSGS
jgi:hypothetical protein